MEVWTVLLLGSILLLALLKIVYVIGVGLTLPKTQGALFVTTPRGPIREALEAARLGTGQTLVDLGCGDGRVLVEASKGFGARALGFEINPVAYLMARIRCLVHKGVEVRYKNFWGADLGQADVVFCYLFPDVMARLSAKLAQELRPGTRVVSCNFPMPDWRPSVVLRPGGRKDPVYIYEVSGKGRTGGSPLANRA